MQIAPRNGVPTGSSDHLTTVDTCYASDTMIFCSALLDAFLRTGLVKEWLGG